MALVYCWALVVSYLFISQQTGCIASVAPGFEQPQDARLGVTATEAEGKLQAKRCAPIEAIPTAGLNLTANEIDLLPDICWHQDLVDAGLTTQLGWVEQPRNGVPPGVTCKPILWCDDNSGLCTQVCERGSVVVDPWLKNALQLQTKLSQRMPLCWSTMLGTHNSGITLADGYGNLDPHFAGYFQWLRWLTHDDDMEMRTNDQFLSLTDQMNVGVRLIELDTHWVDGDFRIAHCGGVHSPLDRLISAINLVAKLLHHDIRWDTETLGCNPSLSSIPAPDQRLLHDALAEIHDWLAQPDNADEFVILFFDDQADIQLWGLVDRLLERIDAVFPRSWVYTPAEQAARGPYGGWPTTRDLLARGKRLMFLSGFDYGEQMQPLIFPKDSSVCGWREPGLKHFAGAPTCSVDPWSGRYPYIGRTLSGELYRVTTCELTYGPMNCDFIYEKDNRPLLDELSLPMVAGCGLNIPSPDSMTPERAAASIWSWAPGHPFVPWTGLPLPSRIFRVAISWARSALGWGATQPQCAAISADDGRWRAVDCGLPLPTACRGPRADTLGSAGLWEIATGLRGACPEGYTYEIPHHALENFGVLNALRQSGELAAFIAIEGPSWEVVLPDEEDS